MSRRQCSFLVVILFMISSSNPVTAGPKGGPGKGTASKGLPVAPDLAQRLARFRQVQMPFDPAGLSAQEQKLIKKLVDACTHLEQIYWRQSDPEALRIYESLSESKDPIDEEVRRYLWINASRFDLIDNNKPFIGTTVAPPGRGFYP